MRDQQSSEVANGAGKVGQGRRKGIERQRGKEKIAKKLHSLKREKVNAGKPSFPELDWSGCPDKIPDMADLVTTESWLVFDLLSLKGNQDWLQTSCSIWDVFEDYKKLEEYATNLLVCNDLAERGIAMITKFINMVETEDQRQALLQVVEYHRSLVKNENKANLKLC